MTWIWIALAWLALSVVFCFGWAVGELVQELRAEAEWHGRLHRNVEDTVQLVSSLEHVQPRSDSVWVGDDRGAASALY